MSFKNAEINTDDMTIVEVGKDYTNEYNILDVLKSWNGIEGISLTIKQDSDLSLADEGEADETD
jgi:hypothetical protein